VLGYRLSASRKKLADSRQLFRFFKLGGCRRSR
jgi:hypothetical protein